MEEHDQLNGPGQAGWNTDTTMDYPIGPDDVGNAVMHAIGFLVTGWHWLAGKINNRS